MHQKQFSVIVTKNKVRCLFSQSLNLVGKEDKQRESYKKITVASCKYHKGNKTGSYSRKGLGDLGTNYKNEQGMAET